MVYANKLRGVAYMVNLRIDMYRRKYIDSFYITWNMFMDRYMIGWSKKKYLECIDEHWESFEFGN